MDLVTKSLVAQLALLGVNNRDVHGSNPPPPTIKGKKCYVDLVYLAFLVVEGKLT